MTIVISLLTIISLIGLIIFKPSFKIKGKEIQTFWIVSLIGALLLIIFREIKLTEIKDVFFSDASINPIKILVLFI